MKYNFYNYKGILYTGMEYTTKQINSLFKIKVQGVDENGKKINTLVGVAGLIKLIGVEFVNKFVKKAFKKVQDSITGGDKAEFKLRRGIKVSFYVW